LQQDVTAEKSRKMTLFRGQLAVQLIRSILRYRSETRNVIYFFFNFSLNQCQPEQYHNIFQI
jgi:hypothetical protein